MPPALPGFVILDGVATIGWNWCLSFCYSWDDFLGNVYGFNDWPPLFTKLCIVLLLRIVLFWGNSILFWFYKTRGCVSP